MDLRVFINYFCLTGKKMSHWENSWTGNIRSNEHVINFSLKFAEFCSYFATPFIRGLFLFIQKYKIRGNLQEKCTLRFGEKLSLKTQYPQ